MKKDIMAEAVGRIDEKYIDRAAESFKGSGSRDNVIEVSFSGRPAPIKKRSKAEKILTGAAGIAAAAAVVIGTVFFADFVSKNKVQPGTGKESSPSIARPEFTEDYKAGVFFLPADSAALYGGNIYRSGELFYVNETSTDTNVNDIAVYDGRGFYLGTYTNLNSSLECEKNESYYFRMYFTERGPIGVRCSVTKSGEDCYSSARKIYFYNDKLKITGTADIPVYENEGKFEGYYLWSFSENGKYFLEAIMNTAEGLKYSLRAFSLENGAKLLFEIPDVREIPCVGENGEDYIFNQFVALNISNDGKTIQTFNNELIDGGSRLSYFSVGYIDISGKEPTAKIAGFCGGTSGVIFDEADSITHIEGNRVDYYAFDEILHINLPLSENEKAITASLSPDRSYFLAAVRNTDTNEDNIRVYKGTGDDKELIYEQPQPCNSSVEFAEINDKGTIIAVDTAGNRSVFYADMTRAENEGTGEMAESIGAIAFEKNDEQVISSEYIYSGLSEKGVQRWYASSVYDTATSNMVMSKNIESGIPAYEGLVNNEKYCISIYEKPDVLTPCSYIGTYNTTKTMAEYREENNFTFTLSYTEKGIAAIKQVYGDNGYLRKITVTFFDDNMNPVTETVLPDNLIPQGEQSAYLCLSHNGRYLLINGSQKYSIFDLEEGKLVRESDAFDVMNSVKLPEGCDSLCGYVPVAVSNNGDKMIIRLTAEYSAKNLPEKVLYSAVTFGDNSCSSVTDDKVYDLSTPVKASNTAVINIEDCCFYYTSFEGSKHVHLEIEENEEIKLVSVSPDESYFIAVVLNTETKEEQHRVYKGLPMGGETVSCISSSNNETGEVLFIRQSGELPESVLSKSHCSVTSSDGSFYVLGEKMVNSSSEWEYADVIKYDSKGNFLGWYRAELPEESDVSDYWLYPAGDKLIMLEEGYSEGKSCCFVRYYNDELQLISKHILPIRSDLDYIGGMITNNGRYFIDERVDKEKNTVLLSVYNLENEPYLVTELNLSFEGRSIEQIIMALISADGKTLIGETRVESGEYLAFRCNMETGGLIDIETIDVMANGGYFSYYDNGLVECGGGIMQFRDETGTVKYRITDNGEELSGWTVSPSGRYILAIFGDTESGYEFNLYDREKAVSENNSEILVLPEPGKTFGTRDFSYAAVNNSGTIFCNTNSGPVFIK